MIRRFSLLALVAAALAISPPAVVQAEDGGYADDGGLDNDSDHDRARDLLEHGEIVPLSEIIAHISDEHPGEVVGVSLVRMRGRWVYQFKIQTGDGKLGELSVDAKSMGVVRAEGHD